MHICIICLHVWIIEIVFFMMSPQDKSRRKSMLKIKTYKTLIIFLVAAMMLLSGCGAVRFADDINAYKDEFMDLTKCDSVSVVTLDHGELAFYGDEDALYQIGSMTKAFTGLAVMKLINEGKVAHDGNVSDYLEGFKAYYNGKPVEITIDELLSQTSGYTNNEIDYPSAEVSMSLSDWVNSISGKDLSSAPGEKYAYSNVNFNLLGAVIESVTGSSYKSYMEEEILKPLSLENTYVGIPDRGYVEEGARLGYRKAFTYEIRVREGAIPAGYFYSCTKDMGRWLKIWTKGEDVPAEFLPLIEEVKRNLKDTGDYFCGWESFSEDTFGHSGGTPNYSSRMVFSKDKEIGVCVLTDMNVAASTDSFCNSIYGKLNGDDLKPISTDVWTVFDTVFTILTVLLSGLLIASISFKKTALIVWDIAAAVLLILLIVLMPMILGAGMKEILKVWAPYSMSGAMAMLIVDILFMSIRLCKKKA